MPEQLNTRVEDCFLLAESFFKRSFKRPQVSLKLRGQKAGVAHLHENLLRFNPQLYRENSQHFLKQTVAHEVAHLIAHQLFGERIQPHGEEWQLIMRGVYELPPDRCHPGKQLAQLLETALLELHLQGLLKRRLLLWLQTLRSQLRAPQRFTQPLHKSRLQAAH